MRLEPMAPPWLLPADGPRPLGPALRRHTAGLRASSCTGGVPSPDLLGAAGSGEKDPALLCEAARLPLGTATLAELAEPLVGRFRFELPERSREPVTSLLLSLDLSQQEDDGGAGAVDGRAQDGDHRGQRPPGCEPPQWSIALHLQHPQTGWPLLPGLGKVVLTGEAFEALEGRISIAADPSGSDRSPPRLELQLTAVPRPTGKTGRKEADPFSLSDTFAL